MKKLKFIIFTFTLMLFFQSCSTIKEGFSSPKKNSTDEFLVEKKSPLVMPPEFNELPEPKILNIKESKNDKKIKELISNKSTSTDNSISQNENLENSILKKIKQN
tara:strand:+ start:1530 stop:1844 length:315 start_codon:yes stop_codon:yes gene_type:complete